MSAQTVDRSQPPVLGTAAPVNFPSFEDLVLSSGTRLLVLPVESPLFHLEFLATGGAGCQPIERPGLASMTAAVLDEGTPTKSSTEIALAAEKLGGYLSSSANWDSIIASSGGLVVHRDVFFALLAEVVQEPTLPLEEIDRLRQLTLAEISRRRMQPAVVASERLAQALYAGTIYQHPMIGTTSSVEAMTRDEIVTYYSQHLRAAPNCLIVTGGVDPQAIATQFETTFSALAPAKVAAAAPTAPSSTVGRRVLVHDRPDGAQTELRVGCVGPPRRTEDYFALSVLNSLLGGKFTSRLNLNLRERNGYTYGANSRFYWRNGPGPFVAGAAVDNENVGAATREILSELERLVHEPIPQAELEETQSYLTGVFPYTLQTLDGLSSRLAQIALYDLPVDQYDRHAEQIRAVTTEQLSAVAKRHLKLDELVTVAVGPATEIAPQLEALGALQVTSD